MVSDIKFQLEQWLTSSLPSNLMAVTLTMKQGFGGQKTDAVTASANLRHFLNVLNQTVYGNAYRRHGKRLTVIPILEMSAWDRLHYHITVEVPDRFNANTFADLIRATWSMSCCRFRGHEDKIVTKETEIGHGETEVHEGVQV